MSPGQVPAHLPRESSAPWLAIPPRLHVMGAGGFPKGSLVLLPEAHRMEAGQAEARDAHSGRCARIC